MRTALLNLAGARWLSERVRRALYRAAGVPIGHDARVSAGVSATTRLLRIGSGGRIGSRCHFDNHAPITLGDNVWIGEQTTFITMTHDKGTSELRAGPFRSDPIEVGDGVWIGARATILPGVTIGRGAIVAAGAVVTRDCKPDRVYAGVPAVDKRPADD